MPLRGNHTFSLLKSKKDSENACILRNIRSIDDAEPYSSGSLGKVTCSDTALPLLQERAYSLTNPSQALWGSQLKTPATDYNCNSTSYNPNLKDSYSDFELVLNDRSGPDSIALLTNAKNHADIASTTSVLTTKSDFQNKPDDVVGSQGKNLANAPIKQKRTITDISGPIITASSEDPKGAVQNHTNKRFPSLEDQQKTLLLLAENQRKASTLDAKSAEEKRRHFHTVKSSSLDIAKDLNCRPRSGTAGSKMAGKIQRTIRALYDGNSEKKRSTEKVESDTDSIDEPKLKPVDMKIENSRLGDTACKQF